MADESQQAQIEAFRRSYETLFGTLPPLPAAKFAFFGDVDPGALVENEAFRARAFYNERFDEKTTQLMLFAMLLVQGAGAAKWHAQAARRHGATWEDLAAVVSLATAVASLGPMNQGSGLLEELRRAE